MGTQGDRGMGVSGYRGNGEVVSGEVEGKWRTKGRKETKGIVGIQGSRGRGAAGVPPVA